MFIYLEDEFYDAEEQTQGRLKILNSKSCLINCPNVPIYIPITQDYGPMTEDMINKHTNYLSLLDDADLRTRAQLDILLSDMQAFKVYF